MVLEASGSLSREESMPDDIPDEWIVAAQAIVEKWPPMPPACLDELEMLFAPGVAAWAEQRRARA